jgi:hypothetical protein
MKIRAITMAPQYTREGVFGEIYILTYGRKDSATQVNRR